jgi:hypothetical protein
MHLSHHHFTTYLQCKLGSSRSAFSDRLPSPTKEPFAVEKWPKTVCLEADCLPNHPTCCLYESFLARCVITISTSQDHSAWVAQLQIDPDLPVPWCPMQHWRHFCRRNSSSQRPFEPILRERERGRSTTILRKIRWPRVEKHVRPSGKGLRFFLWHLWPSLNPLSIDSIGSTFMHTTKWAREGCHVRVPKQILNDLWLNTF